MGMDIRCTEHTYITDPWQCAFADVRDLSSRGGCILHLADLTITLLFVSSTTDVLPGD